VLLEYDFVDCEEIDLELDSIDVEKAGVKVQIRITEDQRDSLNLEAIRGELVAKGAKFVRPIVPTVVRRDESRETIVDPSLDDAEVVQQWIGAKKPTEADRVTRFATEALEQSIT
jgi:hypothetical protein